MLYIARDRDESLWIYENRPVKDEEEGCWKDPLDGVALLMNDRREHLLFSSITWEDKEPRKLDIEIKYRG